MSQRVLLALGVLSIAASFLVGTVAMTATGAALSMMGQFGASNGPTISIDKAQQSAQSFLDRRGNQDLRIDELMEFDQNFYALIKEKSSGVGAFELLVNKQTAVVSFEPGPDMMWNAKYGMMNRAGMMGFGSSTGAMTLSRIEQPRSLRVGSTGKVVAIRRARRTPSTAITPSTSKRPARSPGCYP